MAATILTIDDQPADAGHEAVTDAQGWGVYPRPRPVGTAGPEPSPDGGPARTLLGAAIGLRTALEQTGHSLATPRLAALLEAEASLAAALAVLPLENADFGEDRQRILHELARAREELRRCRRLGSALSETVKHALGQQAVGAGDYGPDGQRGHLADRTVGTLQMRG